MKKTTERKMSLAVGVILFVQVGGVMFILIFNAVHKHRYHRDLLATQELTLRFNSLTDLELRKPRARAQGDEILVDGCLHNTTGEEPFISQVNVELRSPKGKTLGKVELHKLTPCKRGGFHFKTKLACSPPDGAILDIEAAADRTDESTQCSSVEDPDG